MPLSSEGFCCHLQNLVCIKFLQMIVMQNLVCIKFLQMIVIFPESPPTFSWGGSQNLLFIFRSFTFCMTKGLFTWTQDSKLPQGNHCQGQVLPREHMMICCKGATTSLPRESSSSSEFVYLLHKLLQRMNFKHVYPFLVISGIIYWEIYSKQ